jgi:hypothetical protein
VKSRTDYIVHVEEAQNTCIVLVGNPVKNWTCGRLSIDLVGSIKLHLKDVYSMRI